MRFVDLTTDGAVVAELGRRVERQRVERNQTQAEFAGEAGVGRSTVQRLENGGSVQLTSFAKILRALGLLDELDTAIPETIELPVAELERQRRAIRQRVRHGRSERQAAAEKPWAWDGDDR